MIIWNISILYFFYSLNSFLLIFQQTDWSSNDISSTRLSNESKRGQQRQVMLDFILFQLYKILL